MTKLIHGEEEAQKAQDAARALFGAGKSAQDMPCTAIDENDFTDGTVTVIDLLLKTKLTPSKSEARRLIMQGGVTVDDMKVTKPDETVAKAQFEEKGYIVIKKGKKAFHKVSL